MAQKLWCRIKLAPDLVLILTATYASIFLAHRCKFELLIQCRRRHGMMQCMLYHRRIIHTFHFQYTSVEDRCYKLGTGNLGILILN